VVKKSKEKYAALLLSFLRQRNFATCSDK